MNDARSGFRSSLRSLSARLRRDDGISMAELLMLAPILMMALEVVALGGRFAVANADIQSAAYEAARQATLTQTRGEANRTARAVGEAALIDKGYQCQNPRVTVASGTNFVAGGQVQVRVQCTVRLSDLGLLGLPGSRTIDRTSTVPIDTFRAVN